MLQVPPQELSKLQYKTENIRNICVLAHVDHGKTSLSDSLIASNSIISEKLAGKIRYLDSTEEEQKRGITMSSSAISLYYNPNSENLMWENGYLINLIDSPGHVDFSSDVSTAVRLTDGALLLVDVVEGVCAQTHAVIRQAWKERVRPCLVLNKMDRLIVELQFSPFEAYQHICRIVEQVNVILSSMITADRIKEETSSTASKSRELDPSTNVFDDWHVEFDEDVERNLFFAPQKGNVVFASAIDGWAFGVGYFANFFAKKLKLDPKMLRKWLWGEYYFNVKTRKATTKQPSSKCKPMFVTMVLEPIWEVYDKAYINPNPDALFKILKSLRISKDIMPRDLRHTDPRVRTQAVMRKWLPLAQAVLRMVVRALPNPIQAQAFRIDSLFPSTAPNSNVRKSIATCQAGTSEASDDDCTVAFVSKVMSVKRQMFSDSVLLDTTDEGEEEILVSFARVFSGMLTKFKMYYVLDSKYTIGSTDLSEKGITSNQNSAHYRCIKGSKLRFYMIMGRDFVAIDSVPVGNLVGIVGLHELVLKTATISTSLECPSLMSIPYQAKPIVKVALEPKDTKHFPQLEKGLQLLYRSDPTVEVLVEESGEHVIVALGELHLERCVKDLIERFARIPINVSEPIVGFRETIVQGKISSAQEKVVRLLDSFDLANEAQILESTPASCRTAGGMVTLVVRAVPLPESFTNFINSKSANIKQLLMKDVHDNDVIHQTRAQLGIEYSNFAATLLRSGVLSSDAIDKLWCLGPKRIGPNILINNITGYTCNNLLRGQLVESPNVPTETSIERLQDLKKLDNSIVAGFQLATMGGPLCDEPVFGIAFVVDDVVFRSTNPEDNSGSSVEDTFEDSAGLVTGQIISTMKEVCRLAMLLRPVRLVEPVYMCCLQCPAEQLGRCYNVLSKRRGNVTSEELSDGTSLFTINANLPVVESFGLASDLLSSTSGAASNPQLLFSHWEIVDMDPYFHPTTLEEREEHGEHVHEQNFVRKYINSIRHRKGLSIAEKLIVHAEKQRTLTRNK